MIPRFLKENIVNKISVSVDIKRTRVQKSNYISKFASYLRIWYTGSEKVGDTSQNSTKTVIYK